MDIGGPKRDEGITGGFEVPQSGIGASVGAIKGVWVTKGSTGAYQGGTGECKWSIGVPQGDSGIPERILRTPT